MAMKVLSEKNKFFLIKKLKSHINTIRILMAAFLFSAGLAFVAYKQHWVSEDFSAYPALLSLVILVAVLAYYFRIVNTRKAILHAKKSVITGEIWQKIKHSDEYSTEYAFVVDGVNYGVKSKHFEAFREGELVKIELTEPGKELIRVKRLKQY